MQIDLTPIYDFLKCRTPDAWVEQALLNLDILLIDHANCEKKAASTALSLMYRYDKNADLLHKMSRLAREELRHFERVLDILVARGIQLRPLGIGRYAKLLYKHIRAHEPAKQMDTLVVGAIIEARSCERFAKIAPFLDDELKRFYMHLLKSESRHFLDYLTLAKNLGEQEALERIELFTDIEVDLILTPDDMFYFHSGVLKS